MGMFRLFSAARPFFQPARRIKLDRNLTKWHQNLHFPSKIRSKFSPTILVIGFIPIFTFALGTWQVRRRRWKLDLIEQLNDQLQREPLELPNYVNLDIIPEFEFRKFIAEGVWDHSCSILLGPKTVEGVKGYDVITPLVREDGSTILVNRGFISREYIQNQKPKGIHQPEGKVRMVGILRTKLQNKNPFTPENRPERGEWYFFDLEKMADWFSAKDKNIQGIFLEELFDGNTGQISYMISKGIPVGRPSQIDLRNMHATYAVTWYSLSAATTIMLLALLRKKPAQPKNLRL